MNANFLTSADTIVVPAVQQPGSTPPASGLSNFYDYVNAILQQRLATAVVKKQKMQYPIAHIGEFNQDWMMCEIENIGNVTGEDLFIIVAKTTQVILYMSGAVQSPPAFTAQ